MRYGQPSIESVTDRLLQQGCERIVMFPLYPQYSATTTATVNDKFFETLMKSAFSRQCVSFHPMKRNPFISKHWPAPSRSIWKHFPSSRK